MVMKSPASESMKKSFVQAILEHAGSPEKALQLLKADCETNPVDARLNLQVLYNTLGREEESFATSCELLKLAPEDPRVLFNHGWHWLKRGELQKGLSYLEHGRPLNTYGNPPPASKKPRWTRQLQTASADLVSQGASTRDLPSHEAHHVLLVLEGGLGDEIIHLRFGKDLVERHGCKVTVICNPSLASVIARIPWVGAVAQREAALGIYHDSWLPGMSAALALGMEYPDISGKPYLTPSPSRVAKWKPALRRAAGSKLRVGIRWAGNPQFEHQQHRLFPPQLLVNLHELAGVQLFSFQRDDNLLSLPPEIIDLGPDLGDWEDTAAALSEMDLVISSCTSIAHMSAALGVPTWVVVPALPYFIWALPGDTSPWYDSVRLFRQGVFGEWRDVADSLKHGLHEWSARQNAPK
jgi:hypothetical protein